MFIHTYIHTYIYIYTYIVYSIHIYLSTLRTIFHEIAGPSHSKSFFRITPTPLGVSRAKRCATDASRERLTWQSWRGEWPDRKTTGLAGYKISMTYLQNVLWNIYNIYICEISIKCPWNFYQISFKKTQKIYEICMKFLSNILKISKKCLMSMKYLQYIYIYIYIYITY